MVLAMTSASINPFRIAFVLALVAVGCASAGGESSAASHVAKIELQPSETMIGAIRLEGFPALSKDGSEIAVLRHDDGMNYSASLVILRRSDQAVVRRFQLLDEEQGGAESDVASIERLSAAVDPANAYLASKSFTSMASLYVLPTERYPPLVQEFESAGGYFTFNRRSGVVTFQVPGTTNPVVRLQRPRVVQTVPDLDPHNECVLDAVPSQGWIDVAAKLVVARIDYVSSKDGCYEPEAWILETIL